MFPLEIYDWFQVPFFINEGARSVTYKTFKLFKTIYQPYKLFFIRSTLPGEFSLGGFCDSSSYFTVAKTFVLFAEVIWIMWMSEVSVDFAAFFADNLFISK